MAHNGAARKWSSDDAALNDKDDLKDTASSPEKKDEPSASVIDGEVLEIEARRKLDMNLNEHGTENGMDTDDEVGDIPPATFIR
jgi:hypothetical protein